MEDHDNDLGLALWAGSEEGASSVTKKALVERDLLGLMEETNYQNSGVDVTLTLRISDPSPGIKKCMFCSDTSTPLWRNGPDGPKTLCNACGIRHRKEVSKINTDLTLGRTPPPQAASGGGGGGGKGQKKK